MQRHGLTPEAIAIEITEGVLMHDLSVAQSWIEKLRAAGLRIFLDDFGTGYSSLSYLKRFQMDTVKVDKSFIIDMNADNNDRTLVDAIITMAGSLGMNVVAEGIEDASQLALLREMGCGYGQGYFFSRPIPAADFVPTAMRIEAELDRR
jgi:EAL domain-containing protein (putative c-di-GMP-specific phosphodiesterase class I)